MTILMEDAWVLVEQARLNRKILVFLSQIKIEDECWIWTGTKNKLGYGVLNSRTGQSAYRFSYWFFKGEIPKGYHVHHTCENTSCVRPTHLKAVTPRQHHNLHSILRLAHAPYWYSI